MRQKKCLNMSVLENLKHEKVSRELLNPLIKLAKKTDKHLEFKEVNGLEWYATYLNEKIVAFTALFIRGKNCRIRSAYVHPNFRGNGIYGEALEFRISKAKELGCTSVNAFFAPTSLRVALRHGFEPKHTNKNGITYAVKNIEN